jgi:hypothetical protein
MKGELKQIDLFDTSDLVVEKFATQSPINKERLSGQNRTIVEYMEKGHTLTSLKAIKKFGITRLASRVWDIKNIAGCVVYDRMINEGGVNVKEYSLNPFENENK